MTIPRDGSAAVSLRLDGDPEACLAATRVLATWREAVADVRETLRTGRVDTEASWSGDAADAFRRRVVELVTALDRLFAAVARLEAGLTAFAEDLCAVRAGLGAAASRARTGGMTVAGDLVLPPGPDAPPEQGQAFDDVARIVAGIREAESVAHRVLREALGATFPSTALGWGWFGVDLASGVVGGYAGQAARRHGPAAWPRPHPAAPRGPAARPRPHPATSRGPAGKGAPAAVRASRIGAVLAHPVGRALTYELGDAAARLRVDSALPTVVAKVPVVGVIGTGYSVHADTRAGMSTTEAVAKNTTVLAAGSAASGLTTTGLVALGFTGGPVVGGAVVSGVVVAAGVGYAWDHREQIADKAEDVADGVRHVALDAGLTATDVADAVRDVALDAGLTATDVAGEAADAVDVVENVASSASAKAGDLVDTVVPDVDLRW